MPRYTIHYREESQHYAEVTADNEEEARANFEAGEYDYMNADDMMWHNQTILTINER